jgi:serine/threonine protein kinase/WD40 repeat protein
MSDGAPSPHPSVEKLRCFGLGQLDSEDSSVIEEHISQCEVCCRTLAEVGPDTLVDLLRQIRKSPEVIHESSTVALMQGTAEPGSDRPSGGDRPTVADLPPELENHPRYRVLALLGSGGMGAVYKAEHRLMERQVALKVMARSLLGSPAMIERFRREVKAAARLSHPNIVTAHDAEQAGDLHLLVMECVAGVDLSHLIAERGPLPIGEACNYVRQTAAGLQHAHEQGMIHRDIKPHNLMLTPEGVVKILDFGLARLGGDASAPGSTTAQGIVLGTVDYMAPEQADDAHQADIRSDIYSLGCTLYHLLSGRPPFPKGSVVQKIMAHTERQPDSLSQLRPNLPLGLVRIVERAMAKLPSQRYQTPADLYLALEPFAESAVVVVAEEPARPPRKPPLAAAAGRTQRIAEAKRRPPPEEVILDALPVDDRRRRRWPIVLALLVLLVGGLIAGAAVYRSRTDKGELAITTEAPNVEVVVKQNGNVVRIIDTKTNKEVELPSGLYELELVGQPEGLRLSLDKVTIQRGDKVVAYVLRQREPLSPAKNLPTAVLLHTIAWKDESKGFLVHINQTGISADGQLFFGAGDAETSGAVRVFDLASGKQVREFVLGEDTGGNAAPTFARFVPGGKYLAVSYHTRNDIYLWDIGTGKLARKFIGHSAAAPHFAVSPGGSRLLSWSDDKTVRVWDVSSGAELRKLEGHADKAAGDFSPDGKQILTFSADKTLRLWDADSGQTLKKLEGHTDACTGCFSPNGKQVLSYGPDRTIRLWQLATGKEVRRFEGSTDKVLFAGFVDRGRLVVGRTADQKYRIWGTVSGKLISEIEGSKYGADGWTLTASPDGKQALVSVAIDGSVRVLDLRSGAERHRYLGCPNARSFSFSVDGSVAVAGSFRAGMFVFRLPTPSAEKAGEVRR